MSKDIIVLSNADQVSDGYHTFEELYEHRNLLFINLCITWYSEHSGGTCWNRNGGYEDYFCLYYWGWKDKQISYHIPNKYLYLVEHAHIPYKIVEWDGHTSNDVIKRLISLVDRDEEDL